MWTLCMMGSGTSSLAHMLKPFKRLPGILFLVLLIGFLLTIWYVSIITNYQTLRKVAWRAGLVRLVADDIRPFSENVTLDGYRSYPGNISLKMHCKTCAYVTGSGHMTGSKKGKEIDSMSCVFRSNNAPVIGYETDVGSRTTLRTVDRNSLRFVTEQVLRDKGAFDPHVVRSTLILAYSDPYNMLYEQLNKSHRSLPQLTLYHITPERYHEILDVFAERVSGNGVWASNGFITIYFAKDVCDEIHVYGINPERFCDDVRDPNSTVKDVPYHYYGGNLMNCDFIKYLDGGKTQTHHFTKEKAFFRTLIEEWGNVYFHAPEWMENKVRTPITSVAT